MTNPEDALDWYERKTPNIPDSDSSLEIDKGFHTKKERWTIKRISLNDENLKMFLANDASNTVFTNFDADDVGIVLSLIDR